MHNVLIIFYIAFSIGNLFILPELYLEPRLSHSICVYDQKGKIMQYHHTKREPEMAELIEGSERDRRRLAELLDGIRVGPGVDAMADGMREAVWADVRSRIRRRGIRMRIVRYAAAAAVMAGVVCGSWFMGGRRTESRLVAAAQPVSVSTPLGVKSDVVLPDGSRVRLNGGTRIVYPALFGD